MKIPWKGIRHNLFMLLMILSILSCSVVSLVYAKYIADSSSNTEMEIVAQGELNVAVTNQGDDSYTISNVVESNVPAYVRFAIVVNWVDSDGNVWPYASQEGVHYTVTADGCSKVGNYYYYNGVCQPGSSFNVLVEPQSSMIDYTLQAQILAEGIQVVPETVAETAWGMTYADGSWSVAASN